LLLITLMVWTSVVAAVDDVFERCYFCSEAVAGLWPSTNYEGPVRHYGESKPFDIKHIKLDLTIDFDAEKLDGVATTTLVAVGEPRDEIVLNSIGLDVEQAVTRDGTKLEFEVTEDRLNLFLPDPVEPGEELVVSVTYSAEKPVEGLYFRTERMGYDPIETQVWTTCDDRDRCNCAGGVHGSLERLAAIDKRRRGGRDKNVPLVRIGPARQLSGKPRGRQVR